MVDATAYVAPSATLVRQVRIGPRARVMHGAVVDAEDGCIEVGECSIICENAVLRGTVALGHHVFVGIPTEHHRHRRAGVCPGDPALPEAVRGVGFAKVAFGVDADWEGRIERYRQAAEVRSAQFAAHADDEIVG